MVQRMVTIHRPLGYGPSTLPLRSRYLFRPFELVTDNLGVTYLQTKKNLTKREARWVEFLADFDVTLVHRPGKENIADPLSRVGEESSVARSRDWGSDRVCLFGDGAF